MISEFAESHCGTVWAWRQSDGRWHVYVYRRGGGGDYPSRVAEVLGGHALARDVCNAVARRRPMRSCGEFRGFAAELREVPE